MKLPATAYAHTMSNSSNCSRSCNVDVRDIYGNRNGDDGDGNRRYKRASTINREMQHAVIPCNSFPPFFPICCRPTLEPKHVVAIHMSCVILLEIQTEIAFTQILLIQHTPIPSHQQRRPTAWAWRLSIHLN